MTYNPEALKAQAVPKTGDRVHATVKRIEKGVMSDFINPDVLSRWEGESHDQAAIKITLETTNGFTKNKVMSYPENNMVSPKSNLAKWKKVYGNYPFEGQVVELVADDEGYYQFLF